MMAAPSYLDLSPGLSGWVFWGGLAVFILTVVVVLGISATEQQRRHRVIGPLVAMAIGLLIFGGGVAWYFWPRKDVPFAAAFPGDTPDRDKSLDNTIRFSCAQSMRPKEFLPDRTLHVIQIIGPPGISGASGDPRLYVAGTYFVQGTGPIQYGDSDPTIDYYRCAIVNYGSKPIYAVQIALEIYWQEVIPRENGTTNGNVISQTTYLSPKIDIGISPQNIGEFYIMSRALSYVYVATSSAIIVQEAGRDDLKLVKLMPPDSVADTFAFFQPRPVPTNPPASSPQVPAPQGTLERTSPQTSP